MLYRVIAKIQHSNGDVEPRRVYLEHLSKEEAERHAWLAVRANTCVSYAWVEPEEDVDEPIYELKPGMVRCSHRMRHTGNQCQLAAGHVGRHAWEPAWVERVEAIEETGDKFTERDEAQLVKPQPPSVKAGCIDI